MSIVLPGFSISIRAAMLSLVVLAMLVCTVPLRPKSYKELGTEAFQNFKFAEAERYFIAALNEAEKAGANNPAVAVSLVDIAWLYEYRLRYAEAEPLLIRALTINDGLRNRNLPEIATNLNMLAIVYYDQKMYSKAEPFLTRAVGISETPGGFSRSQRLILTDNLANLYRDTGQWMKAEQLYRREMEISEVNASVINELGGVCYKQGKFSEAEIYYKRAFAMNEKSWQKCLEVLNPWYLPAHQKEFHRVGDYWMVSNLNNLAELYKDCGKYQEAEPLCKRALAIVKLDYSFDHAHALHIYAEVLRKTNREAEASALEAQAKVIETSHCYYKL